ncbi:MAG: HPr(Ser) kinase/phosphatase [Verrucomicrobia bacterium]|nr:HPr(Ser) kinase/phosphatase [Verrucomicrobiota bacterium]
MPLRPQAKVPDGISVQDFYTKAKDTLKLSLVAGENGLKRMIRDKTVNRPALAITGYFRNFASRRVQLFGAGEMAYLKDHPEEDLLQLMRSIVACTVPCMFVSRNLVPFKAMLQAANESRTPLFRSQLNSRDLTNMMTIMLEQEFAPKISEHGTLMDVRGIGTLIRGKSGVGKSECALALIERGHSLVADDLVYIRQINDTELVGRSSELNRGYMECRGIGIINIAELFGIRAVRVEKNINLVVTFAEWTLGMDEERTGLEQDYFEILGVRIPHIVLPVRPGRDLARLVEVASMVQALKMLGHDSAKEFNDRLIRHMTQS